MNDVSVESAEKRSRHFCPSGFRNVFILDRGSCSLIQFWGDKYSCCILSAFGNSGKSVAIFISLTVYVCVIRYLRIDASFSAICAANLRL